MFGEKRNTSSERVRSGGKARKYRDGMSESPFMLINGFRMNGLLYDFGKKRYRMRFSCTAISVCTSRAFSAAVAAKFSVESA